MLGSAFAHVKWFTDPSRHPTDYSLLSSPQVIAAFAVALGAVAVAWWIQHHVPEPRVFRSLERFAGLGPLALGAHLGVALVVAALLGLLFVPSLRVERDALGTALLLIEGACGLLLGVGLFTRPAALLLALLGVIAMAPFSFESILEEVHLLGIAAFLFVVGRGAVSIDRLFGHHRALADGRAPATALLLLRIALGTAIVVGALTEKLLDPGLSAQLLDERPYLDVLAGVGIGHAQFAYLAGLVELVVGAVILSGQLTRPAMTVGAVLFTVTLPFFGWLELLGHLPYYGIMLTLFIAPNADTWRPRTLLQEGRLAV